MSYASETHFDTFTSPTTQLNSFTNRLQNNNSLSTYDMLTPLGSGSHGSTELHLQRQIQSLQSSITQLQAENNILLAAKAAYEEAFKRLTSALQLSSDPTTPIPDRLMVSYPKQSPVSLPKLSADDAVKQFPKVRFWTVDKFKAWEKSAEALGEGRGSLAFLENKDGTPFAADDIAALLKKMRAIWQGFKHGGNPPQTWGAATNAMKQEFYAQVTSSFPDLGLCSNNWKAETVATLRYSSWAQTHLRGTGSKESQSTTGKRKVKSESSSVEPVDVKRIKHHDDNTAPGDEVLAASTLLTISQSFSRSPSPSPDSSVSLNTSSTSIISDSPPPSLEVLSNAPPKALGFTQVKSPFIRFHERKARDVSPNPASLVVTNSAPHVTPNLVAQVVSTNSVSVSSNPASLVITNSAPHVITNSAPHVAPNLVAQVVTDSISVASNPATAQVVTNSVSVASNPAAQVVTNSAPEVAPNLAAQVTSNPAPHVAPGNPAAQVVTNSAPYVVTVTNTLRADSTVTSPSTAADPAGTYSKPASAPTVVVSSAGSTWQPQRARKGRTLCGYRWLHQVNLHGSGNEFNLYWKNLTIDQRKRYDEECANLLQMKGWIGFTPEMIKTLSNGELY